MQYTSILENVAFSQRPISVRCLQVSLWSIAVLEKSQAWPTDTDGPSILSREGESQLISRTTFFLKFLLSLVEWTSNKQHSTGGCAGLLSDPLLDLVGLLSPPGASIGYFRVTFQLFATFSRHHRICAQLLSEGAIESIVCFLDLILKGIYSPIGQPLGVPSFTPKSPLRHAVVDALLTLNQCFIAIWYANKATPVRLQFCV